MKDEKNLGTRMQVTINFKGNPLVYDKIKSIQIDKKKLTKKDLQEIFFSMEEGYITESYKDLE